MIPKHRDTEILLYISMFSVPRCFVIVRQGIVRIRSFLIATLVAAAFTIPAAAQSAHLLVVVGIAGDAEEGELFQKWGATLADAASARFGIAREHVIALSGDRATREEVQRALDGLAHSATADDPVFIVLIGHGSFDGRTAKFNLRGPDMTAADFAAALKRVRSKQLVFVNTASASGPFVAELSAPGRTIVTATRNGSERFATLFGGYFVDALTSDAADADRNRQVSVLEAFDYARREVARAYQREGLLATEHALLDDNGDGEGTGEPTPTTRDGRLASALALGSAAAADPLPEDPKMRALYAERRELERRVEAIKLLKASMDPARYLSELEKALTALALKTREIRQAEGKP